MHVKLGLQPQSSYLIALMRPHKLYTTPLGFSRRLLDETKLCNIELKIGEHVYLTLAPLLGLNIRGPYRKV